MASAKRSAPPQKQHSAFMTDAISARPTVDEIATQEPVAANVSRLPRSIGPFAVRQLQLLNFRSLRTQ